MVVFVVVVVVVVVVEVVVVVVVVLLLLLLLLLVLLVLVVLLVVVVVVYVKPLGSDDETSLVKQCLLPWLTESDKQLSRSGPNSGGRRFLIYKSLEVRVPSLRSSGESASS